MLEHIDALFDGSRVVHSPYEQDAALIRRARAFLDGHTSTERIYARALASMESEAPQEFSLVRAVGADAGTVLSARMARRWIGACPASLPAKATGNCSTNGCRVCRRRISGRRPGDGPGNAQKNDG